MKPFQHPALPRRFGFTLIELITVVTVIAILSAILIAAVGSSINRAISTKTISGQRSLYMAIMSYTIDHGGRMHLYSNFADNPSWGRELYEKGYTDGDARVLVSPATDPEIYNPEEDYQFESYGLFFPGFGNWLSVPRWPEFLISPMANERPSEQMLLGDSVRAVALDNPEDARDFYTVYNGEGVLHLRHSGKAYVTYLDGRVAPVGPKEIRLFYEAVQSDPTANVKFSGPPLVMNETGQLVSVMTQ